jgi:hypothetical protein
MVAGQPGCLWFCSGLQRALGNLVYGQTAGVGCCRWVLGGALVTPLPRGLRAWAFYVAWCCFGAGSAAR